MLNIVIQNTGEGTNESASYRYHVYVNDKEIECNFISGHNREDGWAALVKAIAERHLTQRAPDAGDSAASQALSPQSGESTPEVNPTVTQRG